MKVKQGDFFLTKCLIFSAFIWLISAQSLLGYSALQGVPNAESQSYNYLRSPVAAYALSILFPGGGHLYLKNYDYFSRYFALETTTPLLIYFVYGSFTEHYSDWQNADSAVKKRQQLNWMTFYGITLYSTILIWFGSKFADLRDIHDSLNHLQKFESNINVNRNYISFAVHW